MPATLFDVSPRSSSAYSVPTFGALAQGLGQFGAGIGTGLQERRQKREAAEKKARADAALKAAFGAYGEGGRDAVFEGLASGTYGDDVLKSLFPIMQMDQAQRNADRQYNLALQKANAPAKTPEWEAKFNMWKESMLADNPDVDPATIGYDDYMRASRTSAVVDDPSKLMAGSEDAAGKAAAALNRWQTALPEINEGMQYLTKQKEFQTWLLGKADKFGIDIGEGNRDSLADAAKFKRTVTEQLSLFINELSGAAVSEQEAERLMKAMPNLDDGPTEFKAKYDSLMNQLESKVKAYAGEDAFVMPDMTLDAPPTGVSPLDVIDAVDGVGTAQAAPGGIPSFDAINAMNFAQVDQASDALVAAKDSMPAEEWNALRDALIARGDALQAAPAQDAPPAVSDVANAPLGVNTAAPAAMPGAPAMSAAPAAPMTASQPAAMGGTGQPDISHITQQAHMQRDAAADAPPTVAEVRKMSGEEVAALIEGGNPWARYPPEVAQAMIARVRELDKQGRANRQRRAAEASQADLDQSLSWLWGQ